MQGISIGHTPESVVGLIEQKIERTAEALIRYSDAAISGGCIRQKFALLRLENAEDSLSATRDYASEICMDWNFRGEYYGDEARVALDGLGIKFAKFPN